MHNMLQSVLVPGNDPSLPQGGGGDGLDYCVKQAATFSSQFQKEHVLLNLFNEGDDHQLPLKVLGDGGIQELEKVHNGDGALIGGDFPGTQDHLHSLLEVQSSVFRL